MKKEMNAEQKAAHDVILQGGASFLTGPAGCGKTFVIGRIIEKLNTTNKSYAVTATTGAAAVNLKAKDACTIDSFLKLGPRIHSLADHISFCLRHRRPFIRDNPIHVLIIEEVSMLHIAKFQLVHELMNMRYHDDIMREFGELSLSATVDMPWSERERKINAICTIYRRRLMSEAPFRRFQYIFLGDYFQLPPIRIKNDPHHVPQIFESPLWDVIKPRVLLLTTVHRQDPGRMPTALSLIRCGEITAEVKSFLMDAMKRPISDHSKVVYLFPKNDPKEAHNAEKLAKLSTPAYTFVANDTCRDANDIELFKKEVRSPEYLTIKIGCRVMLLRNISKTLINGSVGEVIEINDDVIRVLFDNDETQEIKRDREELHRLEYCRESQRYRKFPYACRKQFPLCLGYAFTIHKAQGLTLDNVVVYLNGLWGTGFIYTALSRARTEEGLVVRGLDLMDVRRQVRPQVRNWYAEQARAITST